MAAFAVEAAAEEGAGSVFEDSGLSGIEGADEWHVEEGGHAGKGFAQVVDAEEGPANDVGLEVGPELNKDLQGLGVHRFGW